MIVKQVYNSAEGMLQIPKEVLPAKGQPFAHHFQSTSGDNLIELAGRVCFDKNTELLTENGWVKISELPKDTSVLTLNRDANCLEYQKPYDYLHKKFTGSMVYLDNPFLKIKTTSDHEWYVNLDNEWQLVEARKLFGYKFYVRRSGNFTGNSINEFTIPDHIYTQKIHTKNGTKDTKPRTSNGFKIPSYKLVDFARFLGYYFSEGCVNGGSTNKNNGKKSGFNIKIYQHINSAEPIRQCLKNLQFKFSEFVDKRNNVVHFSVYEAVLARYLQKYGTNSYDKYLPRECLNWPSNLRNNLLNAMMYGDGGKQYGRQRIYSTKSKRLADDLQELIIKNNKTCTLNINTESTYILRECNTENSTVNNPSTPLLHEAVKNEDVYCVSVNNRILVTRYNNCIIFCGNCYDSAQQEKTRGTVEYHKHINDVGHWSTHSHLNITIELPVNKRTDELYEYLTCFINKPGFYIALTNKDDYTQNLRITGNLRAIREWFTFNTKIPKESDKFDYLGYCLQSWARLVAPEAIKGAARSSSLYKYAGSLVIPTDPNEIWISYYIGGVSRSLTHELCRHGFSTGISQRSSRYCDESESECAWHPLLMQHEEELLAPMDNMDPTFKSIRYTCQNIYRFIYNTLTTKGVDRKAARGAARGVLGNALSTELIFSASLAQWQRIILMRSRDEADAEIRLMTNEIFKDLKEKWPNYFYNYTSRPAKDGIGLHVEKI